MSASEFTFSSSLSLRTSQNRATPWPQSEQRLDPYGAFAKGLARGVGFGVALGSEPISRYSSSRERLTQRPLGPLVHLLLSGHSLQAEALAA
jgi:hypothetical protein